MKNLFLVSKILMGVSTLGRQPGLPPIATELLEMIDRNVQLEAHFIEDLLDLTRITRGKLELARMPISARSGVMQLQFRQRISRPKNNVSSSVWKPANTC